MCNFFVGWGPFPLLFPTEYHRTKRVLSWCMFFWGVGEENLTNFIQGSHPVVAILRRGGHRIPLI
jgi:hypothetical protein